MEKEKKKFKGFSLYFSEEEFHFLEKKAGEKHIKISTLLKSTLIKAFLEFDDFDEKDNPFKK